MEETFQLQANDLPIQLDQSGITLIAPGLSGSGACVGARLQGATRDFTSEKSMLDQAIVEASLEDTHTIILEAETPVVSEAERSRAVTAVAPDEMMMQVPLNENEVQFVIYKDEADVVSFHFAEPDTTSPALPSRAFGAASFNRFRLPLRRSQQKAGGAAGRGLFATVAKKIVKVVTLNLLQHPVSHLLHGAVEYWENQHRAFQGFHGANTASDLISSPPAEFHDWKGLANKKSLLFIHGTTSTTAGAFAGLLNFQQTLAAMSQAYENRVIGFNHHTMSKSVAQNIVDLYDALSNFPGTYTFDVITHSRGGLVARAITGLDDNDISARIGREWKRPQNVRVEIDRLIFAATPNSGTDLADPKNIPGLIDRLANYVNFLPDSAATVSIGALMALASSVAQLGLRGLPGLADQAPGSDLLRSLKLGPNGATNYYALEANFEPAGNLVDVVKDGAVDHLFGEKENDLVVPTLGVSQTAQFSLPDARVKPYGPTDGVHHTNFFEQLATAMKLESFLGIPSTVSTMSSSQTG